MGYEAGRTSSASNNTFVGTEAGKYSGEGSMNSFFGNRAGRNNSGNQNTFIGHYAGASSGTGNANVFVGNNTGGTNTTGSLNTFVGVLASGKNKTGGYNSFFGYQSGYYNDSGIRNAFFGWGSGLNNKTGSQNTYLGFQAGRDATGSGNVFIGYGAGLRETGSNKLYIHNKSEETPLIYGDFATDQLGINTKLIPTGYTMGVKGKLITEEIKVQTYGQNGWPDYVFAENYELPSLKEVEEYIKEQGHLKNMPSAKKVEKEGGIELGVMNAKLLEKIEELTLYTIQQEKKLQEQEKQLIEQENRLKKLEAHLNKTQKN